MSVKVRQYRGQAGVWEVDINLRMPDGTWYRRRLKAPSPTEKGAERWAEAHVAHVLKNGRPAPQREREVLTLEQFEARFIEGYAKANGEKESSIHAKQRIFANHLVPAFGTKRLDQITTEDVQRLKAALLTASEKQPARTPKTVNNVLTVLNTALRTAVDWGLIPAMPCKVRLVKAPAREIEFYDFAQYAELVAAAEREDWRIHVMVLLAGDAGLRLGEILGLEWTDIDFKRSSILIQRSDWRGHTAAPKGGRSRRVPMTLALAEVLRTNRHLVTSRVLYGDDRKSATRNHLMRWLQRAQRRANLKPTGALHVLRHTFCSHLAMRGATPKAIQELAGHQHLSTTQRYMHLSPAHKDHAIALLNSRPTEELAPAAGAGEMLEKGGAEAKC